MYEHLLSCILKKFKIQWLNKFASQKCQENYSTGIAINYNT